MRDLGAGVSVPVDRVNAYDLDVVEVQRQQKGQRVLTPDPPAAVKLNLTEKYRSRMVSSGAVRRCWRLWQSWGTLSIPERRSAVSGMRRPLRKQAHLLRLALGHPQ